MMLFCHMVLVNTQVLLPVLMTVQSSQVGVPISSVHISWI
ncbi:hypothetical protein V6Z11_D10G083800 [Gossypium hirsutum]